MQGKRVYPNAAGWLALGEPGTYGQDKDGLWWCHPPSRGDGRPTPAGVLSDHTVTEHEDGTITVSPSILYPGIWHGYLERGVWREC